MKTSTKAVSAILASALIIGAAGCGGGGRGGNAGGGGDTAAATTTTAAAAPALTEDPNKEFDVEVDLSELSNIEEVDTKNEEGAGKLYESGKKAGTINALCYYKFENEEPERYIQPIFAERFGGTVEVQVCGSTEYTERLGTLMAAGDSPDLVRYEWPMLPGFMIQNRFTALDDWLDIESPLWADMRDAIDYYQYKGNHCYFPQERSPGYGVIYNTANIEAIGAQDPTDLYFDGEWTWNEFEEIMKMWKSSNPEGIGLAFGASAAIQLAATTGTVPVEFTGTDIVNNIKSADVMRTMEFLEKVAREGLMYEGDYLGPDNKDAWQGQLMFFIMPPEWALKCGQQTLFERNLEGTVRFVPLPRDPESDTYYQYGSTYGYLVPSGAKNVQGAVSWILAGRIYRTDPEVIAADEEKLLYNGPYYYAKCTNKECSHVYDSERGEENEVCPECGTPRKPKFKVTYDDRQLQVKKDMIDSSKMTFRYDEHRGFGSDCWHLFSESSDNMFDTPLHGEVTFVQQVEEYYNVAESYFNQYRELLK